MLFDPECDGKTEIEERKVAHIVRKLMDRGELTVRFSSAHLLSEW
jgi:hypothetical protein